MFDKTKNWVLCACLALAVWSPSSLRGEDPEIEALRTRLREMETRLEGLESSVGKSSDKEKKPDAAGDEKDVMTFPPAWWSGKDIGLKVKWNYGLEAESEDKRFKVHVGGRAQIDGIWLATSQRVQFGLGGIGLAEDAVNFRRARLDIEATMYETIDFYVQYDFLNTFDARGIGRSGIINVPVPTDLWATFTHLPYLGNLRIGNQKPPISFEHMTSSRFLNFMERSLGFDAFIEDQDNGFRPGIQFFNWDLDQMSTWALGVFKNNRNPFGWNVGNGEYDVTGRYTHLLLYEDDGTYLVHVGLGGSYRDLDDSQIRLRSRIAIRDGPATLHNVLSEARMLGKRQGLVVPEFAMVYGPITVQSEYEATWITDAISPIAPVSAQIPRGTAFYQATYIEVLYFLTGEHQNYNRASTGDRRRIATFGRTIPRVNFAYDPDCGGLTGCGAWQVGVRYSYLDLIDKDISGGVQSDAAIVHDMTLGLNWFLNPNLKVQWNYSLAYRDTLHHGSNGFIHAFGTRLAFDF